MLPTLVLVQHSQVDPRVLDAVLGAGIAILVALVIAAETGDSPEHSGWAYLFAAGFGALMVLRRRFARTVLMVTVLGVFGYYAFELTPIGIALPAVAALYSAAEQDRTRWAIGAGALLIGVSGYFRVAEGLPTAYLISYDFLTNVALVAAAVALGVSVRTRRQAREQQHRIAELTAAEHARESERRVQEERFRLARDVHDVVGHTLSVVAVHANVADEALGAFPASTSGVTAPIDGAAQAGPAGETDAAEQTDTDAARLAIRQIQEVTSHTMRELRGTVRLLRTPGPDTETPDGGITAPGLADLSRILRHVQAAGVQVEQEIAIDADVSQPIAAAAHRIIQESLTNVIKHSGATTARVSVQECAGVLHVEVRDDGAGATTPSGTADGRGEGIPGMIERARLLGGEASAASNPGGGFTVRAELPARLSS